MNVDMFAIFYTLNKFTEAFGINEVIERLKALGIHYELDEHEAVFTNANHDVEIVIDESIRGREKLGFHPNINTATVWISYDDLMKFVKACGNTVAFVNC